MRTTGSASVGLLILAASCQAGQTQEQEHNKTVREIQAEMERDLRGQAKLFYGSDPAARWKAEVGKPGDRSHEMIDPLRLPSPPREKLTPGTVSVAELRQTGPRRSYWKSLSKRAGALLGIRHAP